MADIAGVASWKTTEKGVVEINVKPAPLKEVVVKIEMNKDSKLNTIKVSEASLEIGIPDHQPEQQQQQQQGGGDSTDTSAGKKPKDENSWRSENVLGNVMNVWKEYKGVIITAVIAISVGFFLRRKFKAV